MKVKWGQTQNSLTAASPGPAALKPHTARRLRGAAIALVGVLMTGCRLDMHIQPK